MVRAAQLMGQAVRDVYRTDGPSLEAQAGDFNVSILLGGQVGNGELRLFQIYSALTTTSKRRKTRPICRSANTNMASRSSTGR